MWTSELSVDRRSSIIRLILRTLLAFLPVVGRPRLRIGMRKMTFAVANKARKVAEIVFFFNFLLHIRSSVFAVDVVIVKSTAKGVSRQAGF